MVILISRLFVTRSSSTNARYISDKLHKICYVNDAVVYYIVFHTNLTKKIKKYNILRNVIETGIRSIDWNIYIYFYYTKYVSSGVLREVMMGLFIFVL